MPRGNSDSAIQGHQRKPGYHNHRQCLYWPPDFPSLVQHLRLCKPSTHRLPDSLPCEEPTAWFANYPHKHAASTYVEENIEGERPGFLPFCTKDCLEIITTRQTQQTHRILSRGGTAAPHSNWGCPGKLN